MTAEKGLAERTMAEDGPGASYAAALQQMAADDVPSFMCHYYNVYFAHTAGGRMIGKSVSDSILGGQSLKFYEYQGDLAAMSEALKGQIEAVAQTWTDEERKRSVAQTQAAFEYAGTLLKCIQEAEDDEPVPAEELAAA